MKKRMAVVLAILFLFLLTGCKSIDYGTVVDKLFSKAHKTWSPIIMHVNKQTRIIPRWIDHSDSWSILVENEEGRDWWSVTESYFNSVEIGDSVDRRKQD